MTRDDFNKLVEMTFSECREILLARERIYSSGMDRLGNFKRAGDVFDVTPSGALVGMWLKQLVSILDHVDESIRLTKSELNEKIHDSINYLILLKAIEEEETWTDGTNTTLGSPRQYPGTPNATPGGSAQSS